jgi:hypothetical protein
MRSVIITGLCMLLLPAVSTAGPIHSGVIFRTPGDWYGHLVIGLERVSSDAQIYVEEEGWATRNLQGELNISGALQELTVNIGPDGHGSSHYDYGRTSVTITALWTTPDGATGTGRLSAWLLAPFEFDLNEGVPGDFTVIWQAFQLDQGEVDSSLAEYLGIGRKIRGGALLLDIDGIEGDPTSADRYGRFYLSSLDIQTVPEPSLWALTAAGALALVRRRYRRLG